MTSQDEERNGGSAVTWRDIYGAVRDSENRIVKTINDAVAPLTSSVKDHEDRIRFLELNGSSEAKEARREADQLTIRVAALELVNVGQSERRKGQAGVFIFTKQTLLLLAALIGMISVIGDLLQRLLSSVAGVP